MKYFISYSWSNVLGTQHGFGNVYVDTNLPLTQAETESLERQLQAEMVGAVVVILNIVELAG